MVFIEYLLAWGTNMTDPAFVVHGLQMNVEEFFAVEVFMASNATVDTGEVLNKRLFGLRDLLTVLAIGDVCSVNCVLDHELYLAGVESARWTGQVWIGCCSDMVANQVTYAFVVLVTVRTAINVQLMELKAASSLKCLAVNVVKHTVLAEDAMLGVAIVFEKIRACGCNETARCADSRHRSFGDGYPTQARVKTIAGTRNIVPLWEYLQALLRW